MTRLTVEQRLEKNTFREPNSGCWLWTGKTNDFGYGIVKVRGREFRAHRLNYEQYVAQIPDGLNLCHKCDTPACVRPDHLFLGDQKANMADCRAKGRNNRGAKNGRARLTADLVAEIRSSQETSHGIANRLGVSVWAIYDIRSGRNWKHIPMGAR